MTHALLAASSPRQPMPGKRRVRAVSSVNAETTALFERRVRLASAATTWSAALLRRMEIGSPVWRRGARCSRGIRTIVVLPELLSIEPAEANEGPDPIVDRV